MGCPEQSSRIRPEAALTSRRHRRQNGSDPGTGITPSSPQKRPARRRVAAGVRNNLCTSVPSRPINLFKNIQLPRPDPAPHRNASVGREHQRQAKIGD